MPIYEWECTECKKIHEAYVATPDGWEESTCPWCGETAKKVPSTFAIRMDGKLATEGGPVWTDQKDDLGPLTCDMQEESSKAYSDHEQAKKEGRELDNVFKGS